MNKNLYESVTNKIIQALENGEIPWKKSWKRAIPQNVSGRKYTGINRLLLELTEYQFPYFLTFNQTKELGGHVKKGEESHLVVFWKMNKLQFTDDNGDQVDKIIPVLRHYRVFNIEQTTLPVTVVKNGDQIRLTHESEQDDAILRAKRLVESFQHRLPPIEFSWGEAAYNPKLDRILLPYAHLFNSEEEFYSTEFHEVIHSTGHPKRLNRKGILSPSYGTENYSQEELVAEIGACFLTQDCGIESTFQNSTAYLQGWILVLKNDSRMILHSAGQAQKAVNFLMGNGSSNGNGNGAE